MAFRTIFGALPVWVYVAIFGNQFPERFRKYKTGNAKT